MPLDEMVPTVELPPVVPLTSQVTVPVLPLLEVAVNGWVPPAATVMLLGAMLKVGGPEGVEDPPPPPQAAKPPPSSINTGQGLCLIGNSVRGSGW